MTDKSKGYTVTPEHFERALADIARRRVELNSELDIEVAEIEAFERAIADIAERYPESLSDTREDAASPAPGEPANRKAKAKGGLANAKRPYKRKQRKRRALVAIPSGAPSSHEPESWADVLARRPGDPGPTFCPEDPEIIEPTPVPAPAKPRTLTGRLMDNGPEDRRVYGHGFESADRE